MKRTLQLVILSLGVFTAAASYAGTDINALVEMAAKNHALQTNVLGWHQGDTMTYHQSLTNNSYIKYGPYVCTIVDKVTQVDDSTSTVETTYDYCAWALYDNPFYRVRHHAMGVYDNASGKLLSYTFDDKILLVVDSTLNTLATKENVSLKTLKGERYSTTKEDVELVMPAKTYKGVVWTSASIPVFGGFVRAEWYGVGNGGWNSSTEVLSYSQGQ